MMAKQKHIVLIRGLSGSGKTTLANLIIGAIDAEGERRIAISADDYFTAEDGTYKFVYEDLSAAHDWCKQEVEACAVEGYDVIVVHNTFTRSWEINPYIEIAQRHGHALQVVSLFDGGLNDAQLAGRCVHRVPMGSISAQRERWDTDPFRGGFVRSGHQGGPHYGYSHAADESRPRFTSTRAVRSPRHRST
jgi:energy-coupling factor transporter ATP-binding protein EcfA2